MHRLQSNQVLPLAGNDVMVLSPLGALQVIVYHEIGKGDPGIILMLH